MKMTASQKRRLLRLVNLLGLIKDKAGVKAKTLADKCGVSERTFFRDLRILEKAGFPVFYRRGYRIFSNFSLEPLHLTVDEALTARSGCQNLLYYQQYSDSAANVLRKIERLFLSKSAGLLKIFESDKTQPSLFEMIQDSPDLFGILKNSIQNNSAVKVTYLNKDENFLEKIFWPEALVCREAGWFFLGKGYQTEEVEEIPLEKISRLSDTNLQKTKIKTSPKK